MAHAMDALKADTDAEMAAVLQAAWLAFGRYEFRRPLEVCRCDVCVSPEEEAALLATPVARMPAIVLQSYTQSAHSSSPVADEQFRALLPRYFELCAVGDWPAHSVEVTFTRLRDADWRTAWPADEVTLIERYFAALFRAWLHDDGTLGSTGAQSMLCLPVHAGSEVEPLLNAWDADGSLAGALKLADFILAINWSKRVRRLGAFWEEHANAEAVVLDWLRRLATHEKLTAAFFLTNDASEQDRLSNAELVL